MRCITIPVGTVQANAYLLMEDGRDDALVIDPGAEAEAIRLSLDGRKLSAIVLTHGHFDHIGAVLDLRGPDTPVYIHRRDAAMLTNPNLSLSLLIGGPPNQGDPDYCLTPGEITIAGIPMTVLHTPGHTPGSLCLRCEGGIFTGDTLFRGGRGRTDLPGGDERALSESIARLLALPGQLAVYPGHGEPTTIERERRYYR